MSYDGDSYGDERSESDFGRQYTSPSVAAPSQLLSPLQAQSTTRYSASLSGSSARSLIESLDTENDRDSVASIDVGRVGFTPRTSVALTETDTDNDQYQPYGHSQDRYDRASESFSDDESNVERMLLSEADPERSMMYDDQPESERSRSEQYGDDDFSEEDFGNLQPEWAHVLSVEEVLGRRTRPLSVIEEVRSSIGSRSQASSRSKFSPSESAPPVPAIPSIYRLQPTQLEDKDPSPQPSMRSFHSRSSTDPGVRAPPRSSSPVKSGGSTSLRDRIAFFEDRSASPALVQGARPGSPSGTHGLGLGLGLSRTPAPGTMFSPLSSSMLSSPYSTAQSMPSFTASASRHDEPTSTTARPSSYHSSMSSSSSLLSAPRPASPVKSGSGSVRSYHSSEASSAHIPSYTSSPQLEQHYPRSTDNLYAQSRQLPSTPHDLPGAQPQPGIVQRMIHSLRPTETESGLFDVRRRQSLRRASGGAPPSSDHTHEHAASKDKRGSGSGDGDKPPSQPRSEGGGSRASGDAGSAQERTDSGGPGPGSEEVSTRFPCVRSKLICW
ncbi:hypothetical protein CPB86DRAFT_694437 [Serendipita vermifera]|nr:hypothetical protein CPB86DRAFT_694437 [Serendipita vermifera]